MPAFIGQRDFHKWHLKGKRVKVSYLGEYEATGVVESSRVCYGGAIKHWVVLDKPIELSFNTSDGRYRHAVYILEHFDPEENELLEIL